MKYITAEMKHRLLTLLMLFVLHVPFTEPANHVFSNTENSAQDKHDAVVAAQIAFPVLFGHIRSSAWNDYAKQKQVSELVMEEDLEEEKIRKTKSHEEANKYINDVRTEGLNRDLYHCQYSMAVLDGTLTLMGEAKDIYTERSIYLKNGGGMIIPCMLASIPLDGFMWYDDIDGQSFNSKFSGALTANDKKQLSIHNAEPFMSGLYRCTGLHKGKNVKNVVYLYVYKTADPGLMFSVYFRTADCDEAKIVSRQKEILKFLCEGETDDSCVHEKLPSCRMETKVETSQLRGRLELTFISYDKDFQNECSGQCEAEQKINRILAKRPFKDLRKGLLDYLAYDDRLFATHARDYLWDPVRTLAEGYYTKHQTYRCPPGFIIQKVENKPACVPCFAGSSKANLSRATVCPICDVGSYAPSAALDYCKICPIELGTIANRKGNKKQDECFNRPATYQPRPTLELDFAGFDEESEKKEAKKNTTKTIITVIFCLSLLVFAIGGFICYKQTRVKKEKETDTGRDQSEAGPGEKQPLAPGKVSSITVPQAKQSATAMKSPFDFLTQALGISPAKQKAPVEAKKDEAKDEDVATEAKARENELDKTVETKKPGEDDTGDEANKVAENGKDTTAEAKKSKATDEDEDTKRNAGSKSEKRSHSSEDDATKTNPSVSGWTPGQTTPAQAATPYASTYPSAYSTTFASVASTPAQSYQAGVPQQTMAQPGYPSQMMAQPGSPSQMMAQPGSPSQMMAQPGYPSQMMAQPGSPSQMMAQPGTPPQTTGQPGYPPQPTGQPKN